MQEPQGGGADGPDDTLPSRNFMDVGRASEAWASSGIAKGTMEPIDTKSVVGGYYSNRTRETHDGNNKIKWVCQIEMAKNNPTT